MNTQTIEGSQELPLITFNSLTSLLREEQKTKVLLKLPEKFYQGYQNFISEKQEDVIKYTKNNESTKSLKEQKIIVGSMHKVQELLNLRLIKISSIAVKNAVFEDENFSIENLIEDEKEYYFNILKVIEKTTKLIK